MAYNRDFWFSHGLCLKLAMKKIVLKLLAIKSAYIAHFSKSPGVLESSKSRLFESVKKNLTFQLFIMQICAKFAKNRKSVMVSKDMLLSKNPRFLTNPYETLSK